VFAGVLIDLAIIALGAALRAGMPGWTGLIVAVLAYTTIRMMDRASTWMYACQLVEHRLLLFGFRSMLAPTA
jgi:hypothetical protein